MFSKNILTGARKGRARATTRTRKEDIAKAGTRKWKWVVLVKPEEENIKCLKDGEGRSRGKVPVTSFLQTKLDFIPAKMFEYWSIKFRSLGLSLTIAKNPQRMKNPGHEMRNGRLIQDSRDEIQLLAEASSYHSLYIYIYQSTM